MQASEIGEILDHRPDDRVRQLLLTRTSSITGALCTTCLPIVAPL